MLIVKTPLRISLFGGGSDLPAFMEKEAGASLTVTIDKFVYVIINQTNSPVRFIHDDIQQEENVANMRNKIVKEALLAYDCKGLDIVSLSDVPTGGSGLGGSSAFTIGLLQGIWQSQDWHLYEGTNSESLAQKACEIEIDKCGYPVGIQDQYAIAYGGLNLFKYYGKPRYAVRLPHNISSEAIEMLQNRLCLVHSGIPRSTDAGTILQSQQADLQNDTKKFDLMKRIRDRTYQAVELLQHAVNSETPQFRGNFRRFGELLHENWLDKKTLSTSLNNEHFEEMYKYAMQHGAIGGKILGAGGGGFFLFYANSPLILGGNLEKRFPNSKFYPISFHNESSTITKI